MDHDFLSGLLDEVALEGLDGITLPMLWFRLQNRPNFLIALDDESKSFLWECIAVHKDVDIYELPTARIFKPPYNRYDYIDPDLGIVLESKDKLDNPYPIAPINIAPINGDVRGSCSTYTTRICITSEIRYDDVLLMSLNQVNEKWGEKLVLVASPKARLLALIGTETNPLIDISLEQYCLLEYIGRSRYLGEVTQGEGGLLSLQASFTKQIHYHRKKLTLKGLVIKQLHYMKSRKGLAITGSLFHLTRFYTPRKTRMECIMKGMCDFLSEKPQNREQTKVVREALDIKETTFKKLFYKPFQKCVKMITIPFKEFCPNASRKEKFTSNGHDRMVKCVQLLKHIDELDSTEYDDVPDDKEKFLPLNSHFDFSKLCFDIPFLSQVYKVIHEAGPEGITSASLGRIITLPRLDVRTLLKELERRNLLVTVLQERGRQKERKYIDKCFTVQSNKEGFSIENAEKHELIEEEMVLSESQKGLKRQHTSSPVDDNPAASKRIKFSDEISDTMEPDTGKNDQSTKENIKILKITSEVSEIQGSNVFTGKAPKLISLTEKIVNPAILGSSCQITDRKLKRMKIVLDYLKSELLSNITELQKFLIEKEKEEGYKFRIDKKSTARMIHKLLLAKKLKIFKAVLKLENQKIEHEFICDSSVEFNDSRLQLAIEQAKFKFYNFTNDKSKNQPANNQNNVSSNEKNKISDKNVNTNSDKTERKTLNSLFAEKKILESQTHPKCLRFKTLHKFLFYLMYDYQGHSGDASKTPIVYHDSMTWKRFVPPFHNAKPDGKGWCFLVDVYTRMPLSIFVKVFNMRHRIIDLVKYLNDEEKCHYLITDLPQDVLGNLFSQRKYLFAFDDVLKYLCYMGLITFGPQTGKLKQEVYIYVHKKAALTDTTITTPGYIHINSDLKYEKKIYTFNTLDDVENFWMDLESVCFHTPLGKYSSVIGKTIVISEANHKPELMESLKNKSFNEVSDVGNVPGDGLGAGGFDSSLFLHSRRNWKAANSNKSNEKSSKINSKNPTVSIQNLLQNKEMLGPESHNRLQRLHQYRLTSKKDKGLKQSTLKKNKSQETHKKNKTESSIPSLPLIAKKRRRVKLRTVKLRTKKSRQPYLDEKDKVAVQKMKRARCEWFAQEDSFLLLCRVASAFLDPISRTLVVPYTVVRDLLHEKFPDLSANKSSRACQRRVRYMMMNSTTANNVAVFLGEAKQDKKLVKDFDRIKPPKTNEAAWKELFVEVVKKLLEKLTVPASKRCKNISLPNNVEVFNQSFDVMSPRNMFLRKNNHKDPESEEEVIYAILYSLIVSAMAIEQDGTEWSYLLHKLYQVYPECVLRSVVSRLRSEKVIAVKKSSCKRDLQRSLMSTFPYRFSVTYENAMVTKFPVKLFCESKELLDILKHSSHCEGLELKGDVAPGYLAAILALVSLGEIKLAVKVPDQVILFDSSLSKEVRSNIVERMINTLSHKDSFELSRLLDNEKHSSEASSKSRNDVESHNSEERMDVDQPPESSKKRTEGDTFQTYETHRSTNASRFALYLLRQELSQPPIERVQHSQDYIVLNSCQVFCHLESSVTNPPSSSSNVQFSQNTPQSTKDLTELRAKILTDGSISEIKESLASFIPPGAFSERNFDEALENIYDSYSPQTLHDAKSIFEEIMISGSIGVSEKCIWNKFRVLNGELSVFEHLHLFREAMLVIRTGVASFVYVCICYAKNWILKSYVLPEMCYKRKLKANKEKNSDNKDSASSNDCEMADLTESKSSDVKENLQSTSEKEDGNFYFQDPKIIFDEEVYFIPRTWRHPDGTLNKSTFIELLRTVLSYIISSPGVSISRVTDHFSLILQPVQTLELLEILEKACCIIKYYIQKPKKSDLFSKLDNICFTKNPSVDDFDHLEPLPDAICNLARIQEAIMQV